jgi:choline-glycine betaine transporter
VSGAVFIVFSLYVAYKYAGASWAQVPTRVFDRDITYFAMLFSAGWPYSLFFFGVPQTSLSIKRLFTNKIIAPKMM